MRYLLTKFLLITVLLILPIQVFAQVKLPDVGVGDFLLEPSNIFSKSEQNYLVNKLQTVAKEAGSLIVVGALLNLPDDSYIDDYANRLFEKWKPGSKEDNNGLLILFFKNDRKIKIEVGYGIEHLVTDLQAGRVIDEVIIPHFKKDDYFAGINNGIDVLASAVKGEYTIPVKSRTKSNSKKNNWFSLLVIFFIIVSILKRFGGRGTTISRKGSRHSRTAWGGPFFFGGGGSGSSFSGGGGGFSGGFGGLSGGGGASGSW